MECGAFLSYLDRGVRVFDDRYFLFWGREEFLSLAFSTFELFVCFCYIGCVCSVVIRCCIMCCISSCLVVAVSARLLSISMSVCWPVLLSAMNMSVSIFISTGAVVIIFVLDGLLRPEI